MDRKYSLSSESSKALGIQNDHLLPLSYTAQNNANYTRPQIINDNENIQYPVSSNKPRGLRPITNYLHTPAEVFPSADTDMSLITERKEKSWCYGSAWNNVADKRFSNVPLEKLWPNGSYSNAVSLGGVPSGVSSSGISDQGLFNKPQERICPYGLFYEDIDMTGRSPRFSTRTPVNVSDLQLYNIPQENVWRDGSYGNPRELGGVPPGFSAKSSILHQRPYNMWTSPTFFDDNRASMSTNNSTEKKTTRLIY